MQHATNTRTIRVLCTGQIDTTYVLKALRHGADGVLVVGCRRGECHYLTGNLQAFEKIELTKQLLKKAGIAPERVEMRFISSAEGNKYIQAVDEFTETVRNLGPSPVFSADKGPPLKRILEGLIAAASDYRIRAMIAKKLNMMEEGNVYNEKIEKQEIESLIANTIDAEFVRESIMACLKAKECSCGELAESIGISSYAILHHLCHLRKKNLIDVARVEKRVPYYKTI